LIVVVIPILFVLGWMGRKPIPKAETLPAPPETERSRN
jgi:hypothetical protein